MKNKLRKFIREIVSTEVEKLSGGAPEVQKNQSGFGVMGKQSDANKQSDLSKTHLYFNPESESSENGNENENEDEQNQSQNTDSEQ